MRIIGKTSDFYDSVLSHGVDNSIVYTREEEVYEVCQGWHNSDSMFSTYFQRNNTSTWNKLPKSIKDIVLIGQEHFISMDFSGYSKYLSVKGFYLIFAGELIPVIHVNKDPIYIMDKDRVEHFCYNYDQFIAALSSHLSVSQMNAALADKGMFSRLTTAQSVHAFFSSRKDGYEQIHHDMDCPVIKIDGKRYVKNPLLRKMGFARCYDPFTTYQKLEMFISGVLGGNTPNMIEIDDVCRLECHGFDAKISFRTRKS